jgi:hypothetical protein
MISITTTTKRLTTTIPQQQQQQQQQLSVLTQLNRRRRRPISSSNAWSSSFQSSPIGNSNNKYVWKEPPGRMRKILDTIRRNEAQLGVMQHKSLPHIKDVCKRIRTSNSAMVTRVDLLEHVYHDCATLMQEMRKTLERIMCQQEQYDRSSSPLLRNHVSQSQQNKEEEDDITTTTTIIDPEANADRGDARNDTSTATNNNNNNNNKKEHSEDRQPHPWNTTTTRFHPNHATTTNPTRASFHLEPDTTIKKDLHQHPLLTELLRFDNNNTTK